MQQLTANQEPEEGIAQQRTLLHMQHRKGTLHLERYTFKPPVHLGIAGDLPFKAAFSGFSVAGPGPSERTLFPDTGLDKVTAIDGDLRR